MRAHAIIIITRLQEGMSESSLAFSRKWMYRLLGWVLLWLGLQLFSGPLTAPASASRAQAMFGSCIGDLIGPGLCCATCGLASTAVFVVFALAWFALRPDASTHATPTTTFPGISDRFLVAIGCGHRARGWRGVLLRGELHKIQRRARRVQAQHCWDRRRRAVAYARSEVQDYDARQPQPAVTAGHV